MKKQLKHFLVFVGSMFLWYIGFILLLIAVAMIVVGMSAVFKFLSKLFFLYFLFFL